MSELHIKDGAALDKYLGATGTGATGNPYFNIPADFYTEIQKGNVPGHSIVQKFGHNDSVANGSWEGVQQTAAGAFNFLTAATKVRVKAGGDGADTAAGAGAQAVTVEGLDDTGAFVSESIELAGAAASALTTVLFWRVYRAYITPLRAGAYGGSNTANIVIENGTGGTDLITIIAGEGQTQYAAYAVPLGKTGYLMHVSLTSESTKSSNFRLYTRASLTDFTTPFAPALLKRNWDGVAGVTSIETHSPLLTLPALTDIWFDAYGAGAIAQVSVNFEILLVDD